VDDRDEGRTRLLDAAERLFYARGIRAVGMDELCAESGLSLRRVYGYHPSKERLVEAFLERRDRRWRAALAEHVEAVEDPGDRVLAVFGWLERWFAEPGFRGCAWINAAGEMGGTSPVVTRLARAHTDAVRAYLGDLAAGAGLTPAAADHLMLLVEGAMSLAGIRGDPEPARQAARAARALLGREA
jgi:AcrR family transcriptional regulator